MYAMSALAAAGPRIPERASVITLRDLGTSPRKDIEGYVTQTKHD
jgi:hypothetical protein